MKLSQAFPSNFLKADDLQGKSFTVTIADVALEELGQGAQKDTKLVLTFQGKTKKMILNKTNAGAVSKLYGDETDNWIGQQITLSPREVEFQGQPVLAIRVSILKPQAAAPAAPKAKPAPVKRQPVEEQPELPDEPPADDTAIVDPVDAPF